MHVVLERMFVNLLIMIKKMFWFDYLRLDEEHRKEENRRQQ